MALSVLTFVCKFLEAVHLPIQCLLLSELSANLEQHLLWCAVPDWDTFLWACIFDQLAAADIEEQHSQ